MLRLSNGQQVCGSGGHRRYFSNSSDGTIRGPEIGAGGCSSTVASPSSWGRWAEALYIANGEPTITGPRNSLELVSRSWHLSASSSARSLTLPSGATPVEGSRKRMGYRWPRAGHTGLGRKRLPPRGAGSRVDRCRSPGQPQTRSKDRRCPRKRCH